MRIVWRGKGGRGFWRSGSCKKLRSSLVRLAKVVGGLEIHFPLGLWGGGVGPLRVFLGRSTRVGLGGG